MDTSPEQLAQAGAYSAYFSRPVGLMPRWRWLEIRREEILAAMNRYVGARLPIPPHWIEELSVLSEEMDPDFQPTGSGK